MRWAAFCAVHGIVSVHAVVTCGRCSINFHHLTGHYLRDPALLAVSLAPLLSAIVAFSVLEGALDEVYWCLTLTGPAAIAMFAWVDALPNQARTAIAAAVLGAVTLSQAARADMAWTFHRVPGYGAIVTGSRTIVDASRPVRAIALTFAVPPDTDPLWVFSLLGGVLSDDVDSPRAVIDRDGSVRYD